MAYNSKQILKTFLNLVRIDSPSGDEAEAAKFIISFLKEIGIPAAKDAYGNVVARVPGSGQPLMLCAHMDTVEPGRNIKAVVKGDIIHSDGSTVLGADNKSTLTAILEAVRYLHSKKTKHRALELVFTREEETSMDGAKNIDIKKLKARTGLIFDKCAELGFITLGSPYIYFAQIRVKGRAAHAGSAPEAGINAIAIAAKAISELKLGRINKDCIVNLGTIKGGISDCIIPETADATVEVRSKTQREALEQIDCINKVFKKYVRRYKAKLFFKTSLVCSGYTHDRKDKFIKEIAALNKRLRYRSMFGYGGGVSDANILNGKKIKTVNLSSGGQHVHTTRESVRLSEIIGMTEWIVEFVKQ